MPVVTGRTDSCIHQANARAMRAATTQVGELDLGGLLTIHRTLMARTSPDVAGRLRTEAVRIRGSDLAPVDALFVPPAQWRVPGALEDLMAFCRRSDLTPLTRTAIVHAHFETIHPFADGDHPR